MFRTKQKTMTDELKSVQQEIKMRHKEFFESQLAYRLLSHPELFPAVKKYQDRFAI
ncbi:hypothetical protein Loa_01496 [Legionella oakridgensis ATCC 33761 = DSM 21215]|uniref:Uncharacterized protein n=1 Tax=Legionella oakridgensis ATCC 33761 = DSM 21215 TaxID=1268635 RepID=W0BEI4_9GAMM|nr:hypothetical protein [Legionella oakridgensis]AHE67047.1 hypothetical protein Loa_01496 [Legionella oakridgensis ATCC 33761 = DSM 21215]